MNIDIGLEHVRHMVRQALERRRQSIVFFIAKQTHDLMGNSKSNTFQTSIDKDLDESQRWIQIESLSQLRAMVGGRFQKLKERWVGAGFPLREHRGDRAEKAQVDQGGWLELSLWISRQGYRTRLADSTEPWLFEIQQLEKQRSNTEYLDEEDNPDLRSKD